MSSKFVEKTETSDQIQKINFNSVMENTIQNLNGKKTSLLLHACCGPCSTACIERIVPFFDITVYFYNPNIHPEQEYKKRLETIMKFIDDFNKKTHNDVKFIEETYNRSDYDNAICLEKNPELAQEAEKGERCRRCYAFRLGKTQEYAEKNNFEYFATTLTLSPYKDSNKVNEIGKKLNEESLVKNYKTKYLFTDFKKKNGYLRSCQMAEEYGMYRQNYCGCSYGLINQLAAEKNAAN